MGQKLVSRATYWRRRVVVLALGVTVLGLPIWAVNKALGGSQLPGQGSPQAYASQMTSHSARPQAGRRHRPAPARKTGDPGSRPSAAPWDKSTSPRHGQQTCAGTGLLLTLRADRHRYGPGEQVTFVVGAVSTRSRPCRIDLGSRFTSVVVDFGGTPLWDSSSCLRGTGSQVVMLKRGTPAFLRVTWDRRTSLSGCAGQGAAARAGPYTAAAYNGQHHSQATTFVLSGRGAARP